MKGQNMKSSKTKLLVIIIFLAVLTIIPIIVNYIPSIKLYFVENKEYFKTIVAPIFTSIAILSTWLLSEHQNKRDENLRYIISLKDNRPVFSFLDTFQTILVSTANNQNAYLTNFYLVGIDENNKLYSIYNNSYRFVSQIKIDNILYDRFLIDYKTGKNEHYICLYQNGKFEYYNISKKQIIEEKIVSDYLDRKGSFPILNNYFYNDYDVLVTSFKEIVKNIKSEKINYACFLLLNFIRIYKEDLELEFIKRQLKLISYIIMENYKECRIICKADHIKYLKGNLSPSKNASFNQYFIKKIHQSQQLDYTFFIEYLDKVIKNLDDSNEPIFDDFILRNVEFYLNDYTDQFSLNYKEKIHFTDFEDALKVK